MLSSKFMSVSMAKAYSSSSILQNHLRDAPHRQIILEGSLDAYNFGTSSHSNKISRFSMLAEVSPHRFRESSMLLRDLQPGFSFKPETLLIPAADQCAAIDRTSHRTIMPTFQHNSSRVGNFPSFSFSISSDTVERNLSTSAAFVLSPSIQASRPPNLANAYSGHFARASSAYFRHR